MNELTKRKLLRVSCHAAALCSMAVVVIGWPFAVLVFSNDPYVRDSAREAINYTISVVLLSAAAIALCFTIIGIPAAIMMFFALWIGTLILPIVAMISVVADPEKPYRYPFTIRLFKSDELSIAQQH